MRVTVHVDGGSRGNPGPAGVGVVVTDADGQLLEEVAEVIGVATNNVAEYRAVLLGIARAKELGASELELVNDSELVARQIQGVYKVKHPSMRPLHREALDLLRDFERWEIRTVRREQNAEADRLVNQALDDAAAG